jgi:hypothetical protein
VKTLIGNNEADVEVAYDGVVRSDGWDMIGRVLSTVADHSGTYTAYPTDITLSHVAAANLGIASTDQDVSDKLRPLADDWKNRASWTPITAVSVRRTACLPISRRVNNPRNEGPELLESAA